MVVGELFYSLNRGVADVLIAIVDGLKGFPEAGAGQTSVPARKAPTIRRLRGQIEGMQ